MKGLVVGSGWAHHAAHAFAARDDVRLVGVVARGSERSVELASNLGVPLFRELADAIEKTTPDLAVVAVSDRENPSLAIRLLEAGAHVLCAHPVGPSAESVLEVADVARKHGLVVSTDYSLRTTNAFRLGKLATAKQGRLLRIEIMYPGRFLPIALDLALALGGPIDAVSAFGRYPEELRVRREASPAAFPPTTVLDHVGGVVSALTPSPHATPAAAVRVTTSSTGGRIEMGLPAGGARGIRCKPSGQFEETEIVRAEDVVDASAAFANPVRVLAGAFVDAVRASGEPPCPLEDEAHLRDVWAAIPRAVRTRAAVVLKKRVRTP